MKLKLKPFSTPNYVIAEKSERKGDYQTAPVFPLREIEANELAEMCDEYRKSIFRKAGKNDPNKH
jgi:hypothetical protein